MDTSGSWQQKRDQLMQRIAELRQQGICYVCHDLQVSSLLTGQEIIFQNDLFRVVLDLYPRMPGHTIVVYKPHRKGFQGPPDPLEEDLSELSEEEAGQVFTFCVVVTWALKEALGADKVYLNTMCGRTGGGRGGRTSKSRADPRPKDRLFEARPPRRPPLAPPRGINHLHFQLFPRYPGEFIGSKRFVLPRSPVQDGPETARRVREVLLRLQAGG